MSLHHAEFAILALYLNVTYGHNKPVFPSTVWPPSKAYVAHDTPKLAISKEKVGSCP